MSGETSSTHRAVAESDYSLVDQGDMAAVVALFAPDVVYDRPGHGRLEGAEAVRRFFFHERNLAYSRHTIQRYLTDGEWVVAEGSVEARTIAGQELQLTFADVFRVRDGLIVERRGYLSR